MKTRSHPLPMQNGIKPSYFVLPHLKVFEGKLLLDFLCQHFSFVSRSAWQARLNSGMVFNHIGESLNEHAIFISGQTIFYYREISRESEPLIPFQETILAVDNDLIIVDKPHFLPVIPSGRFLRETLLTRLRLRKDLQHLNIEAITPIHRLDKDTAGVMLFSHNPNTRAQYQNLFQNKQIQKTYQAIAPLRLDLDYPFEVQSRMVRGETFFLTQEIEGEPNAHTEIDLLEYSGRWGKYQLKPITGKKHQLRVHMMRLNMPLQNDMLYPEVLPVGSENYDKPLKLLAKRLEFIDPISQKKRIFESEQDLQWD